MSGLYCRAFLAVPDLIRCVMRSKLLTVTRTARGKQNHANRGSSSQSSLKTTLESTMCPAAVSACPTCFPVLVHAHGPCLRRLAVLQTVVDVGGLPAGVLPVLDVLVEVEKGHRDAEGVTVVLGGKFIGAGVIRCGVQGKNLLTGRDYGVDPWTGSRSESGWG